MPDAVRSASELPFITAFDQEYERVMREPSTVSSTLYSRSIQYVATIRDISVQEYVLTRLLIVYPDKYELYYYMGYIWRDEDATKALLWFQLCFRMQPAFVENVLDFTKILFDRRWFSAIHKLSQYSPIQSVEDDRVQILIACMCIEDNRYQEARGILQRLMVSDSGVSQPAELRWVIRLNLSKVSPIVDALSYLETILDEMQGDCDEGEMSKETASLWRNACSNYLLTCDYVYTDHARRFAICRRMNRMYPRQPPMWRDKPLPVRPSGKIRIGYVSYAFSYDKHAVSNFILPILAHHDRSKFEVVLFTQQAYRDYQCPIVNFQHASAEECATMIRREGIDILFDLDGHVTGNRLDAFSYGPAPVQITYLGYPNSTGMDSMQYRLTDLIADPLDSVQLYSETKLYLPRCFLLFDSVLGSSHLPSPTTAERQVILGAVNKESKNSPETLATWRTILARVEHAKILFKLDSMDNTDERRAHYREVLGIPDERLLTFDYSPRNEDYLAMFQSVDVVLDTFPYSGTTTTCNALYCSLPVVTLYHKDYHSHNVSASLLTNCGYTELIAYSTAEYVDIAVALCNDSSRIDTCKREIRERFVTSMDPVAFMKDYETLLQTIHNNHDPTCRSQSEEGYCR